MQINHLQFFSPFLLARCPTYLDVPNNCRLVVDPKDPCCKVPECFDTPTPAPVTPPTPGLFPTLTPVPATTITVEPKIKGMTGPESCLPLGCVPCYMLLFSVEGQSKKLKYIKKCYY